MTTIENANALNLNIPYPWNIDWIAMPDRPIGLFAIQGWIETRIDEINAMQKDKNHEGNKEVYESEIYEEE